MNPGSGHSVDLAVLVTREVRWFFDGPLPDAVLSWFSTADTTAELRTDWYDLRSALNGVGRKRRNGTSFDTKFRLESLEDPDLGTSLNGTAEDWVKISEPIATSSETIDDPLPIRKKLHTRRFVFQLDPRVGGDAELADLDFGSSKAWSLCIETFGDPAERGTAFDQTVARFLAETPIPDSLRFETADCASYPEWLSVLTANQDQAPV